MYQTILVPHEGTPAGDEALRHAIHIAKASATPPKIILLHVVEEIMRPPIFVLSSSERKSILKNIDDANMSIKEDMEKLLEKRREQCTKDNIKSEAMVSIGNGAEKILYVAKQKKADIIVMAKRRKLKGIKKLLSLGSVSRKVVENVTCPVVLVDIEGL